MAVVEAFLGILGRPTIGATIVEMVVFLGPVWIAFLLGVMVGWAWKPRWASLGNCKFDWSAPSSPSAFISSPLKGLFRSTQQSLDSSLKIRAPSFGSCIMDNSAADREQFPSSVTEHISSNSSSQLRKEGSPVVMEDDFEHLRHLVERKDGGPPWKNMMDRSTPTMSCQAWQRDPETGPPQLCSRTVYEDATPEMVRDFFWDDEFRVKWDDMLRHAATILECPTTGTMIVHWIRKFPFFCSDREYTIGRRIWESGKTYYCVTKGVSCPSVPRRNKPRRVDLYYSSWFIQAVGSRKGEGQPNACEVILFHHEDMGIPWEIAKFGVRQGMWGTVRNIERGFRAYQKERASGAALSRTALVAHISTNIDPDHMISLINEQDTKETELVDSDRKPMVMNIPKLFVITGVVVLAYSIDRGLVAKALIFGAARRFANIGRKVCPRRQP